MQAQSLCAHSAPLAQHAQRAACHRAFCLFASAGGCHGNWSDLVPSIAATAQYYMTDAMMEPLAWRFFTCAGLLFGAALLVLLVVKLPFVNSSKVLRMRTETT